MEENYTLKRYLSQDVVQTKCFSASVTQVEMWVVFETTDGMFYSGTEYRTEYREGWRWKSDKPRRYVSRLDRPRNL